MFPKITKFKSKLFVKKKVQWLFVVLLLTLFYYYFKDTLAFLNESVLFDNAETIDSLLAKNLKEDNQKIMFYIIQNYLHRPNHIDSYNLIGPLKSDYSMGQTLIIKKLMDADPENSSRTKFFVECGAYDGEIRSNTLYFEKHGWLGLLIEPDPNNFIKLLTKKRKSYAVNACLCPNTSQPRMVTFIPFANRGHIQQYNSKHNSWNTKNIGDASQYPCFSLYTLILTIKKLMPSFPLIIDYFSLDIEGAELDVLKTIPFHKIYIKTMSVEFTHVTGGKYALIEFMSKHNFVAVDSVEREDNLANDIIFANRRHFTPSVLNKIRNKNFALEESTSN